MHSVSEFIIYGVIEALAIMLLAVILLVTYNFSQRGRIKTLDGWLAMQKHPPPKATLPAVSILAT
ncbi:MAG: hypothetical protein ACI82A_002815 [Candidatus Azotimanducaceae bacterium]|jgi:hypothetical protein